MIVAGTLVAKGDFPRARVQQITGKGTTVSAEIIKLGIEEGAHHVFTDAKPPAVATDNDSSKYGLLPGPTTCLKN